MPLVVSWPAPAYQPGICSWRWPTAPPPAWVTSGPWALNRLVDMAQSGYRRPRPPRPSISTATASRWSSRPTAFAIRSNCRPSCP
ncbi:hypothetical protein M8494_06255 [Serratia ureilytica]